MLYILSTLGIFILAIIIAIPASRIWCDREEKRMVKSAWIDAEMMMDDIIKGKRYAD